MTAGTAFVFFLKQLPETKDRSLEEIERDLRDEHDGQPSKARGQRPDPVTAPGRRR